jgi:hypothetical protein
MKHLHIYVAVLPKWVDDRIEWLLYEIHFVRVSLCPDYADLIISSSMNFLKESGKPGIHFIMHENLYVPERYNSCDKFAMTRGLDVIVPDMKFKFPLRYFLQEIYCHPQATK